MTFLRIAIFFLALSACSASEFGTVEVFVCPPCPGVFSGFETCAFYEVDDPWAREGMLVDKDQFTGVGTPISVAGYMHHKFCFNDSHVVFGSANPTTYGLLISDNLMVRVESQILAQNFAHEYGFLQNQSPPRYTRQFHLNNQPVEHVFCPRHNCEDMVLSYIHSAQREITFLSFSFTSRPIGEALIAAHLRGVKVQGVFDNLGAGSQYSQYHPLKQAGIPVHRVRPANGVMHHKAFVIDDTAIIGSFNPSQNANTRNAETLVALKDPLLVAAIQSEFARLSR